MGRVDALASQPSIDSFAEKTPSFVFAPATPLPYVWMLCGAASFALMSVMVSQLGHSLDFRVIATVRTLLAMLFAATLARRAGAQFVFFRPATLWMRSLAGSVALVTGFYSLTKLPTSEVLTLTNMFPIWVAVLSWPLLRVRPGRETWGAVACGIAGVLVLESPSFRGGPNWLWLVPLGSSFCSAIAMIGLHKLSDIDHRAVVTHFSAVSAMLSVGTLVVRPAAWTLEIAWSWTELGLLLAVGATATIGQIFLTRAFAAGPPGKVAVIGLSQVGFAMLLEMLLWSRRYEWVTLFGIFLVVAPSAWLMWRDRGTRASTDASSLPSQGLKP